MDPRLEMRADPLTQQYPTTIDFSIIIMRGMQKNIAVNNMKFNKRLVQTTCTILVINGLLYYISSGRITIFST